MSWTDDLSENTRAKLMTALDTHGTEHLRYAGNDRPFAAFLLAADQGCHARHGVSIFDLADFRWRDAFDDGLTPAEALTNALTAEGF